MSMESKPLALGTKVPNHGKIDMVGITGGERYYWLSKKGVVSMLPASVIEPMISTAEGGE